MSAPQIARIATIDVRLRREIWDFAIKHTNEIEADWQKRRAANPRLYNGKVLLMSDVALRHANGPWTLTGVCFGVDYKAFLAWQDLGHPGAAKNLFAMAALRSADGAYMLGEMAPWTANAGQIYFPCGTPDLNDLAGDALDLEGSALRELAEETGLTAADVMVATDWTIVFDGARVACMKDMRSPLTAAELVARTAAVFAQDQNPELTRLVPVFGADDICDQMPAFMGAYLQHAFAAAQG